MEIRETNRILKIFLLMFLTLILGYFFISIKKILTPFILSFILAYILNPIISYFESRGTKRLVVVILFYIIGIFILTTLLSILIPLMFEEIERLRSRSPFYIQQMKLYINMLKDYVQSIPYFSGQQGTIFLMEQIIPKVTTAVTTFLSKAPIYMLNITYSTFSTIMPLALIPFISFFALLRGREVIHSLFKIVPSKYVETFLSIICEIDEVLGKYIRGQLMAATIVAIMASTGLTILDVDLSLLLGMLAGIGNLIPYLGPLVGGIPAAILTFFKTKSLFAVLKVVLMFMGIQFIDNNFISPFIVGGKVRLHPVIIIFSLLVGAQFFGPIGMLFAVPSVCIIKITFTVLIKHFFKQYSPKRTVIPSTSNYLS